MVQAGSVPLRTDDRQSCPSGYTSPSLTLPVIFATCLQALQEFRSTHSDEVLAEPSKSKLDIGQDFLRQRESLAGAGLTDLLMVPYSEEFRIPKEGPKRGVRVIV